MLLLTKIAENNIAFVCHFVHLGHRPVTACRSIATCSKKRVDFRCGASFSLPVEVGMLAAAGNCMRVCGGDAWLRRYAD